MDPVKFEAFMEEQGHLVLLGILIVIILIGVFLSKFRVFRFIFATFGRILLFVSFLFCVVILIAVFSIQSSLAIVLMNTFSETLIIADNALLQSNTFTIAAVLFGISFTIILLLNTVIFSFVKLHAIAYKMYTIGSSFFAQLIIYPIVLVSLLPEIHFSILGTLLIGLSIFPIFLGLIFGDPRVRYIRSLRRGRKNKADRHKRHKARIELERWERERPQKRETAQALQKALFPWIYHRKKPA